MTASCIEKGSGRGDSLFRGHKHTHTHFTSCGITRPHLSTQKWANKFSSRSYMNWQSYRLMYSHGYWFYLSVNTYASTHADTLALQAQLRVYSEVGRIQFDLTLTAESGLVEGGGVECEEWSDGFTQMPVADTCEKWDDLELTEINDRRRHSSVTQWHLYT